MQLSGDDVDEMVRIDGEFFNLINSVPLMLANHPTIKKAKSLHADYRRLCVKVLKKSKLSGGSGNE